MRSPIPGESFSAFIKEVLSSYNFNWYVKLGFVPERHHPPSESRKMWESIWEATDPEGHGGWTKTPGGAWECLEKWLDEIQTGPRPHGPGVRNYLRLEESRTDGQVVFHLLIADWNGFENAWEERWKEISNGWAKTRELDERTGGLLSYLVMKAGCMLELNCGRTWGRYSAQDFRPWNPKRY
jgi:hypothetical protein